MATSARPAYRADIQGLRGLAICLVIAYHLWTSGRVSGGVDVFLFISAYLMTASFLRKGTAFRLVEFLIQRFRRLVPLASIVVATTLFTGWLVQPPTRHATLVDHGWAALFYRENWQLIADAIDYTAPDAAHLNPFQHFWSLSVQGQVFVLLPLAFVAAATAHRRAGLNLRSTLAVLLGLATVVSFAHAQVLLATDPAAAYLSTWTRVWEFTLAGLVALLPPLRLPDAAARLVSWAGIALLLLTGLLLGREPFPGWVALVPLAAAASVMVAGTGAGSPWHAGWWLSRRPALFVANRAYSLYLWHWPVYAFWSLWADSPDRLDPLGSVVVLTVSLVLADLTMRLVERRFQGLPLLSRKRYAFATVLTFSMIAASAVVGMTALMQRAADATASLPPEQRPGARVLTPGATPSPSPVRRGIAPGDAAVGDDWPQEWPACEAGPGMPLNPDSGWCHVYDPPGEPTRTVAVVGDSHAHQWTTALGPLAEKEGWRVVSHVMPACRVGAPSQRPGCPEYTVETIAWLLEVRPDWVVSTGSSARANDTEHEDWGWAAAIAPVAEAGIAVVNIRDNPRWSFNMPECVQRFGSLDERCRAPRAEKLQPEWPRGPLADLPNQHFLDFSDWLCPPSARAECLGVIGNTYVYMDSNHLSATYVSSLTEVFEQAWREEVGV